jgi:hypothetical protein
MVKYLLDLDKNTTLIMFVIIGIIIASAFSTPILSNLELENIFNSFLINETSNNIITTNLEPSSIPPLLFWINNVIIHAIGFNLNALKIVPALAMAGIILLTYNFIYKKLRLKSLALISITILATSPFFIAASNIISIDLIYILLYASTLFIFTTNVYSNQYSNIATFIAGILIALAFSLTGIIGAIPLIINFLLINFIRGGFIINLKFNNPLVLATGFLAFVSIWLMSLAKTVGMPNAIELLFNYDFLNNFTQFNFEEKVFTKYVTLFIIGIFPWIALLPASIWAVIKNINVRLNTSDIKLSLPLIALANSIILIIYFSNIEQEFYILLTIAFNLILVIANKLNDIQIRKSSIINIVFFALAAIVMVLFVSEVAGFNLTNHKLNNAVMNTLVAEHISLSQIPLYVMYIVLLLNIMSVLILAAYAVSQNTTLLTASIISSIVSFGVLSLLIFPNLNNNNANQDYSIKSWLINNIDENAENIVFYKIKEPLAASMAKNSFYFDDIKKSVEFLQKSETKNAYIFYNRNDLDIAKIKTKNSPSCLSHYCVLHVKK